MENWCACAAEGFDVTDGINWEEVHRGLQEVLESLKDVVNSHPSLNSADLLHLSASIISNVKGLFSLSFYSHWFSCNELSFSFCRATAWNATHGIAVAILSLHPMSFLRSCRQSAYITLKSPHCSRAVSLCYLSTCLVIVSWVLWWYLIFRTITVVSVCVCFSDVLQVCCTEQKFSVDSFQCCVLIVVVSQAMKTLMKSSAA